MGYFGTKHFLFLDADAAYKSLCLRKENVLTARKSNLFNKKLLYIKLTGYQLVCIKTSMQCAWYILELRDYSRALPWLWASLCTGTVATLILRAFLWFWACGLFFYPMEA